jgi:iron complex outermembrane receptor protein
MMKTLTGARHSVPVVVAALLGASLTSMSQAQQAPAVATDTPQEVIVTGSRIAQTEAQREQPLSVISSEAIEKTGLADIASLLQQLTTGGSTLNTKFNSSGNFGYPPDGGGIGAGASEVDLRNLDPKRALVLVDGIRWVNESSASGVSGSADLNTIPLSIVDHIEVLEDGASSIYGSDAIAGVVNVITKKRSDGVELDGYTGKWSRGGQTTEGNVTAGASTDRFSAIFVASYYKQNRISSGSWWQSAVPEPYAGNRAGSSATPQGRVTFCDPSIPVPNYGSCTPDQGNFYDVTLNNGTTTPVWNPNNPVGAGSTYHNWSTADRFNFAPFNLLLTPSERRSIFTGVTYEVNDYVDLYLKGLYNTRQSVNQAAPEPIFVGPYAGTGGLADTISVSALNPYNPFGITLDSATNFGWATRRPLEAGPRIFTQDVNTWYVSGGFRGVFSLAGSQYHWDLNWVDSQNNATQVFTGGYNVGNLALALGDPAVCALVPNCVPLDLFGGQGRKMTPAMINFIEAVQRDSSEQDLKIYSANITGHPFSIQSREVGIAVGAEHRTYVGSFNPDPLRVEGLSQDSPAQPVFAGYSVNEGYAELSLPLLSTLGASAAARFSDYSNFGSTTTYKGGLRWQPVNDFGVRGTYSTGFRAPNIGELYGLTQFAPTLVDPCSGAVPGPSAALVAACRAQGVPDGFVQANTQIVSYTGGNAKLQPEKSKSFTAGFVYDAGWAVGGLTEKLSLEATYFHHKVNGAIQAADLQSLLNACLAAGGTDPLLCSGFSRAPGGNLRPPNNFLENFGSIKTDGEDFKLNWRSAPLPFGRLSLSGTLTVVNGYKAVDDLGNVAQRAVGIEVNNSAIPRYRMNAQIGYGIGDLQATWTVRFLSAVSEYCSDAAVVGVPGCQTADGFHTLGAVAYNDFQLAYMDAFSLKGLTLEVGVNNLFGVDPPVCYSCTLNGYDAGTYDLPGAFWNVRGKYKF